MHSGSQEVHQGLARLQVESKAESLWQSEIIWQEIHKNLLISDNFDLHTTIVNIVSRQSISYLPRGLCDHLFTDAN